MTELQKDRAKDVALAVALLPFALVVSPLLVLWWFVSNLRDCWEHHAIRHARNEWIAKEAQRTQECQHKWSGVAETTGLRVCLNCRASDWPHRTQEGKRTE